MHYLGSQMLCGPSDAQVWITALQHPGDHPKTERERADAGDGCNGLCEPVGARQQADVAQPLLRA